MQINSNTAYSWRTVITQVIPRIIRVIFLPLEDLTQSENSKGNFVKFGENYRWGKYKLCFLPVTRDSYLRNGAI